MIIVGNMQQIRAFGTVVSMGTAPCAYVSPRSALSQNFAHKLRLWPRSFPALGTKRPQDRSLPSDILSRSSLCPARPLVFASAQQSQPQSSSRSLTIIHFNDVYDIAARSIEPVGGAARFTHLVHQYASENPLILFSGDCLNPSLLSAFTLGEQMPPILNEIGVQAAVMGNHEADFGLDNLRHQMAACNFPWLLSNVFDVHTHQPLAGCQRSLMIEWQGLKIGLLGLVEKEWLLTIPCIDCNKDIIYLDFVEVGRKLAKDLHDQGADMVIALTHMRGPNDEILAAEVPEIQLILGGHDHDYLVTHTANTGMDTVIIKSGTDFREFSVIRLEVPEKSSSVDSSDLISADDLLAKYPRPVVDCQRIEVTADVPEHANVALMVEKYVDLMGHRMDEPLGRSFVDLDTRFDQVRSRETNAGNLMGDIMRLGLDADAAFLNGGTIRSDQIHAAGRMSMRDYVSMLPFTDELVVLGLSGRDVLAALETGVSSWPKREGRFLQVSGIKFKFDPTKPAGSRIVPGSVIIARAPLDLDKTYNVATKAYLRSGKDGFDTLLDAPVVVDGETAPRLATLVHHLLTRIEELNNSYGSNTDFSDTEDSSTVLDSDSTSSTADDVSGDGQGHEPAVGRKLVAVSDSPAPPEPCAHGLDALYYYDKVTGQFGIAPMVEGRIVNVGEEPEQQVEVKLSARDEFRLRNDSLRSVTRFIEDALILFKDGEILQKHLYHVYCEYCAEKGYPAISKRTFGKRILKYFAEQKNVSLKTRTSNHGVLLCGIDLVG